jgi:hypothetical protein
MTPRLIRCLHRLAVIVFDLPPGILALWPALEHEPLVIGLILCFSVPSPWQVKESSLLLGVDWQLREMWQSENWGQWSLVCQLCQLLQLLDSL